MTSAARVASLQNNDPIVAFRGGQVKAPAVPGEPRTVRREQLSDEVAGHLRAAIMLGALRPGTFIRLDGTAAQLGVSITPVREALRTLRGEGMVVLEPHRGHVVAPLSRRDVEDIFWLQATIARELAVSAAERITDDELEALTWCTDALADAVADANPDAVAAAEFAFQRTFTRASGRTKLGWFLLHVSRYMPPLIYVEDSEWGTQAVDNHRGLVAALRRHDIAEVVDLTGWQFDDGVRRLIARLEKSRIWS
jgi:DNA-binding GntR family transcriptional regulator